MSININNYGKLINSTHIFFVCIDGSSTFLQEESLTGF
ncbi:MAG: hypothetical protein JWQ66_2786 [Mucilaginibacter sp.]|nr:hypothetical protein [Mucilaginibacter sp.]